MTFFDQFTPEQIKAQYSKNADVLDSMVQKAKKKGTYNGFSLEKLKKLAKEYRDKSL